MKKNILIALLVVLVVLSLDAYIDTKIDAGITNYIQCEEIKATLMMLQYQNSVYDQNRRDRLI